MSSVINKATFRTTFYESVTVNITVEEIQQIKKLVCEREEINENQMDQYIEDGSCDFIPVYDYMIDYLDSEGIFDLPELVFNNINFENIFQKLIEDDSDLEYIYTKQDDGSFDMTECNMYFTRSIIVKKQF